MKHVCGDAKHGGSKRKHDVMFFFNNITNVFALYIYMWGMCLYIRWNEYWKTCLQCGEWCISLQLLLPFFCLSSPYHLSLSIHLQQTSTSTLRSLFYESFDSYSVLSIISYIHIFPFNKQLSVFFFNFKAVFDTEKGKDLYLSSYRITQ